MNFGAFKTRNLVLKLINSAGTELRTRTLLRTFRAIATLRISTQVRFYAGFSTDFSTDVLLIAELYDCCTNT